MSGDNMSDSLQELELGDAVAPNPNAGGETIDINVDNKTDSMNNNNGKELSDTESATNQPDSIPSGKVSPVFSDAGSVRSTLSVSSKVSGIRAPSTRIGRPCCKGAPKPAVPPATPSRQGILKILLFIIIKKKFLAFLTAKVFGIFTHH